AVQLVAGADGTVVSGCSFNSWSRGVYVNGANACTITGNRFTSLPNANFGLSMNPLQIYTTQSTTVVANVLTGSPSNVTGIYVDSTCTAVVVAANTINNNYTNTILNNGVDTIVANNAGYNPVGANMTDATVGASPWAYQNQLGAYVTAYVSGGIVTSVT